MTGLGSSAPSDVALGTAPGRWVLTATVLASGIAFLDATAVQMALPAIGRDLDASLSDLQWIVNGYTLPLAALILLGGSLGDRYGRRRSPSSASPGPPRRRCCAASPRPPAS